MPYFNPLHLPDGRRPNRPMPDNGDLTIPPVLWQKILMFVAQGDLFSVLNCRSVCRTFRNLIDDYKTYAVIDMGDDRYLPEADGLPPQHANPRFLFYQHCFDAGNPEAVFRRAMIVLRDSGNVRLCMNHLRTASIVNGSHFPGSFGIHFRPHPVAFYMLTMFNIILGPEPERSTSIDAMIRRLDRGLWYIHRSCEEAHSWIRRLDNATPLLCSHLPKSCSEFLPQRPCEQCGEGRYLRQVLEDLEWVNGDFTLGWCCYCCETCLCYIHAAAFYKLLIVQPYNFQDGTNS